MMVSYTVPDTADAEDIRSRLHDDGFGDASRDDSAELARLHIQVDSQDHKDQARASIESVVGGSVIFDDEYGTEEQIPANNP